MSSTSESAPESSSVAGHAKEVVEQVAEAASEYCSGWTEQCKQFAESAEDYVRKQPMKSLLMAAGVGLLIGLAIRR